MGRRRDRGIGTTRALLLLPLIGVLAAGPACSSGGSDDGDGDAGGSTVDEEEEGPMPGEDVSRPTVSGPLTGGTQGGSFNAMPDGLAEQYDYVEEEYLLEGDATAYDLEGEQTEDGHWSVTPGESAPYRTRVIVRRPADTDAFDGTVFVEWLNVTAGIDADPEFGLTHPEIMRSGSAYVAVSAQQVSIEGGGGILPIEIPGRGQPQALKEWDPERYGELSHPGDAWSYDIYSQAAQAIRRPGEVDLLDGMTPRHVIAMGESQSAARMVTYVNAVHPLAGIYDGFLIHSRGGGGAPLAGSGLPIGEGVVRIRTDLDVPVMQYITETDLFGVLAFHGARQDDSDLLRTWEVAGTAHADRAILDYGAEMAREVGGGFDLADLCGSINEGSQADVLRAALAGLRTWVVDGEAPPEAPPLDVEGGAIARDAMGIARGGIRTPAVDAPVVVLTGEAPPDRSIICMLFGDTKPIAPETLAEMYPAHEDYMDAVTASAEAAVEDGYLLQAEADAIVAKADDEGVPT
jgi:hypothetical protein